MFAQKPATILFVDDDRDSRDTTTWLLRQAGFTVWEAASGGDALRLAEREPDLVVLDVHLPDVNGFEVCRRLKENPATAAVPVLHISGVMATSRDRTHGLEGGADAYLTKPVEPDELVAHVKALLRIRHAEEVARASAERLSLVIDTAYDAFVATDAGGVLLDWNCQAEHLFGWPREEALGRGLADLVIPPQHRDPYQAGLAQMLRSDSPVQRISLEITARHRDGHEIPVEVMLSLVRWRGAPLFNAFVRDLTARKRADAAQAEQAARAAFAADVGAALTRPGSLTEMLQRCAEAMVRHLGAAFARVWTLNEQTDVLELQASAGLYTHRDGVHSRIPVGRWKIGQIAQERRAHQTNDVANDPRISDPEWARREGMIAFAGHPLISGGKLVGVLGLFARQPFSAFTQQALAAAADNIAAGIHRKQTERTLRATEAEFRVARRVQQHLFPRTPPALPGFDIDGRSYPAEATGGDYYDYIPLRDGALGVVIGDVSGHGVGPALLMASTRASLRALALADADVSAAFAGVNRILAGDTQDEFVTLFLARLEPQTGSFTYVSAGHVAGYLLDAEGRVKRCLESTAMPLGILPDAPFPTSPTIPLEPGDLILLLTDGVTDARCPDETPFGAERALAIARLYHRDSARQVVENLYGAVRAFMQDMPQFDDVSLVVIKCEPLPGGR